jgi:hypothetical protein
MPTVAMMVKTVLLLLFVAQILIGFTAAARPLEGADGWRGNGIQMVTEFLHSAKSGPNPPTHCC